MPTVPTSSHLRRICRCAVFVSIFLMVMDSRLRPTFLPQLQVTNKLDPQMPIKTDARVKREAVIPNEPLSFLPSLLLRKIRQPEEEQDETEEPTEDENADDKTEADGEALGEGGEEAEKADAEDETDDDEETAAPTTKSTRGPRATTKPTTRATTRASTRKHTGTGNPRQNNKDDDDDDDDDDEKTTHSTTTTTTESAKVNTTEDEPEVDLLCTIPAIRQFPPGVFDYEDRGVGTGFLIITIHLTVVVYMFLCLAIVCDDYFCGSLEQVCKRLHLSEDVAGATLMAAGSSAPELFCSLIGVFVAKGDVGTGTIVGSAVFNILFVVGTCAFFAGAQGTQLSWWPVMRDTSFYSLSIVILVASIADGEVSWYESLIMLFFYGVYVAAMRFNTRAYEWVSLKTGWTGPVQGVEETTRLSGVGRFDKPVFSGYEQFADEVENDHQSLAPQKPSSITLPADERYRRQPRKLGFAHAAFKIMMSRYFYPRTRFIAACRFVIVENQMHSYERRRGRMSANFSNNNHSADSDNFGRGKITDAMRKSRASFDIVHDEVAKWRLKPQPGASWRTYARWAITYPVYFVLYYTIPDSKKERFAKWYIATFVISIIWIAVFSYIMVWMVTVIGHTLSIPDSIMGITFLAAGTSIPDAMASLIVARQGMADMAVSNSIGSNVFDILIGLALPWFISTAMVRPGKTVQINSNGLVYNAVLLFVTVGVAVGGLRSTGWQLTRRIGIIFYITYGVYLIVAVMIEYNVFGFVNPRMCNEEESVLKESIAARNK